MKFAVIWTYKPDHTISATERFSQTGGMPPEGVTMLARWHDVSGNRGFAIAETDDASALATWCRKWNDLLSFEVFPVINDEEIAAVLSAVAKG